MIDAINWWERELTAVERTEMFDRTVRKGASWSDIGDNDEEGIKKRHQWLRERYNEYKEG